MSYKIYFIKCAKNNKGYVGITSNSIENRWESHISNAVKERKMKNGKTIPFMAAIKKYGPENFKISIIDKAKNVNEAYKKEIFYIKKYRTYASGPVPRLGYNCIKGGFNYHRQII